MSVFADLTTGRPDVAVVRQPIADERHTVVGYELLFGGESQLLDSATRRQGDLGAARRRVRRHRPRGARRPPSRVDVDRTQLPDRDRPAARAARPRRAPDRRLRGRDDLLGVLQQLGRSGYTLALEDFDGRARHRAAAGPLLDRQGQRRRAATTRRWSRSSPAPKLHGALLVATHVASAEDFERCRALGFSYFQGDFFAKPRVIRHRGVGTGGVSSLRALGELSAADASFEDLERIISSDVGLSLKLLRYVNSAFFALPRNIGSVREALTLLGTRTVRRWATVMAMSAIPDAPHELVAIALHRARMCEMLAGSALPEERETLFTIGLFSVSDGLMGSPMQEVLESLPFSDEIRAALLRREGPKGDLLSSVLAYERGEFPSAPAGRPRRRASRSPAPTAPRSSGPTRPHRAVAG